MLLLSTLHIRALLPTSSSTLIGPSAPVFFFKKIFWTYHPHVNFYLITEHQCVPSRPFSTQITGFTHHCFAGLLTCLRESSSSKLLSARNSISLSILLLPKTYEPWEISSSTSWPYVSMNKDREVELFLLVAAAICLLNFNLSVGDIPTAWTPQVLAGIIPARNNFLTPTFM